MRRYRRKTQSRRRRRTYRRKLPIRQLIRRTVVAMAEKKYITYPINSLSVQSGSDAIMYSLFSPIAVGAGLSGRVGLKIKVSKVCFNLVLTSNGIADIIARMSLVKSKRGVPNGSIAGYEWPPTVYDWWDPEKWIVFKDKNRALGNLNTDGRNNWVIKFTWNFKQTVTWDSDSTDNPIRPVYLFFESNDATVPSPIVTGQVRIYFTDI